MTGNKIIINDMHLLVTFHESFLFTHFQFFQNNDPAIKNSAFLRIKKCHHVILSHVEKSVKYGIKLEKYPEV